MIKLKSNKTKTGIYFPSIKILQFPSSSEMVSDEDILSLMSGLITLVKKSTEVKCEEKYLRQIERLNNEVILLKRKLQN